MCIRDRAQGHYFSTVVDSGQAAELLKAGAIIPATDHWTRPASQLSESNP